MAGNRQTQEYPYIIKARLPGRALVIRETDVCINPSPTIYLGVKAWVEVKYLPNHGLMKLNRMKTTTKI